jgi:hypothetical protein
MRVSTDTDHPDAWGGFVFLAPDARQEKEPAMRGARDGEICFIANIPHQIEADWNPRYAHLAGFPLNIMFTGIRKQGGGRSHMIAACYWFEPGSYQENEEERQMTYVSRTDYGYLVKVIINKQSGAIESRKYKGQKLISQSHGDSFTQAMIHATLCGVEPDEGQEDSVQL